MSRIRRPNFRKPFGTKRARRPVRWIDANSSRTDAECRYTDDVISCFPTRGKDLIYGDLDMDWSDKTEVTLSRLVGQLSFSASSNFTSVVPLQTQRQAPQLNVVLRAGILVREEVGTFLESGVIDLFDPENIEEFEWMWLKSCHVPWWGDGFHTPSGLPDEVVTSVYSQFTWDLDLRVKRKLGKQDHLVLFRQWAVGAGPFDVTFQGHTLLRELMMS